MGKGMGLDMGKEFAGLDFNSARLEKRFVRTMNTLAEEPSKSIWCCSENRAEAKAIYRMLSNDGLDRSEILKTHREATIKRMVECGGTILLVQDTTSLNYNTQTDMEGIGYIAEKTLGVNIHSCLAVTTEGLVLGTLAQSSYNRSQPKDDTRTHESKKTRLLEEKESFRWVETISSSAADLPLDLEVVTVCDREGDMYELFDSAEKSGKPFLIRVVQNRKTTNDTKILDEIRLKTTFGRVKTLVPRNSSAGVKEHEATLQIRYGSFEIKRPQKLNKIKTLDSFQKANLIYVCEEQEEQTDKSTKPVEWYLLTNLPIKSFDEAYEKARWYMQRWKIEQFHYVLKSGCKVEKLQERSMDKTTLLVLMYSIISTMIMNVTYIARVYPLLPCTVCFEENEWKLLYKCANRTKTAPEKPYAIAEAVTYLSWLGGPKRAPSDGPPGVKIIWMGLDKFYALLDFQEIFG